MNKNKILKRAIKKLESKDKALSKEELGNCLMAIALLEGAKNER
jgi:hypothetical protein